MMSKILCPASCVFAALILVIQYFNNFFFGEFNNITGTLGDARFLLSVFEHWHNVFLGVADWQSPNFFYPIEKTLGFSDALLGAGIFHHMFRVMGFDPFHSYQLTLILTLLIGFFGTYWVFRSVLRMPHYISIVGAMITVSINGLQFQAFHGQLLFFAWLPMLFGFFYKWTQEKSRLRHLWLASALLLFVVLLFTSFYAIWFGVFLLLLMLIIWGIFVVVTKRLDFGALAKFFVPKRGLDITYSVLVLLIAGYVFVDLYGEARQIGLAGDFGWKGVVNRLPLWTDIFYIERFNWLYNDVFSFYPVDPNSYQRLNDLSTGYTPGLLLAFFAAFGFLIWTVKKEKIIWSVNGIALLFAATVVISSIFLYRIGDFSLWRIPFLIVPGADGIRGASRLNLVLGQFMVMVVFYASYLRLYKQSCSTNTNAIFIVSALAFIGVEQINKDQFNYDRVSQNQMLGAAQPPQSCEGFFVTDSDKLSRQDRVVHISANLISTHYNLPTPMGHSGVMPTDYRLIRYPLKEDKEYTSKIAQWLKLYEITDLVPMCEFNITDKSWTVYSSYSELAAEASKEISVQKEIHFSKDEDVAGLLTGNWTRADTWGRWTQGQFTGLRLPFEDKESRQLVFSLGALINREKTKMTVDVFVNGSKKAEWFFQYPAGHGARPNKAVERIIKVTPNDYDKFNTIEIDFKVQDPRTPSDMGKNPNDKRELGLSIYRLTIASD